MDLKRAADYFMFSRQQAKGILSLFVIIIILQLCYFYFDFNKIASNSSEKQKWLSLQSNVDSLKRDNLNKIVKIYPFNPNFISDYKGYKLGMSVQEIDRLFAFRKLNKYVNSSQEFQNVTQVSDSLLGKIAPLFKFPDWVKNREKKTFENYPNKIFAKKEKMVLLDINHATQEDLVKIYGVGDVLSQRILKLKENLGGFVSMDQMNDVWGVSPEVVDKLKQGFKIVSLPTIKKIDINNASLKDLAQFPYFKYTLARQIVIYRSMNGDIKNIEDLIKIKDFPVEKINIIALYLVFY